MKTRIGEKRMLTAAGLFIFLLLFLFNYKAAAATPPSPAGGEKIIFLHHSTGGCVYSARGGSNNIPNLINIYNTSNGTSYSVTDNMNSNATGEPLQPVPPSYTSVSEDIYYPNSNYGYWADTATYGYKRGWCNYPYDYCDIWINHIYNGQPLAPVSNVYLGQWTIEHWVNNYDLVIFKHCFPGAQILADTGSPDITSSVKSLENYKLQYNALKEEMHQYPNTKFIVWTLATMTDDVLQASYADRGRTFVDWVKNVWDESNDNIYIFNFYDLETGGAGLQNKYMLDSYAVNPAAVGNDCHPNSAFSNDIAAPAFFNRIIEVLQANHAPYAGDQSATTIANTAKAITLAATDADGNPLSYSVGAAPAHGTLTGSGANRTYTPSTNYVGSDSFTFKANDGLIDSNVATISITVTAAVNHAPVAVNNNYTIQKNTTLTISAPGVLGNDSDPDGDSLTAVTVSDSWGTRTLNANGSLTYIPQFNYTGTDSFRYKVYDGSLYSNEATITIIVTAPVNNAPVAQNQNVTTNEDMAKAITLAATDADGNPLTYSIVTAPAHGALTGSGANRTYTPSANYCGADSFTFKANDGVADSNIATVSITVTSVNDAPVAQNQSVTTNQDTAKAITLAATDADGNPLTYSVVTAPIHGALTGSGANRTYTPAVNYTGTDSFTFKANDGFIDSNTATVSITVTAAVNHAPVTVNDFYTIPKNTTLTIAAPGVLVNDSDPDGNPITAVTVSDSFGTRTLNANGSLTYLPQFNYTGTDSFRYKVYDGSLYSNEATITITVTAPANNAPVAQNQSVTTNEDTAKAITLVATDADGNPLTYSVVTAPAHGTLTGSGATRTYTPAANYSGTDSFTFKANDGSVDSNTATVSITITSVNDAPVITAGPTASPNPVTLPGTANLSVTASDADSGTLTYTWEKMSGTGTVGFTPNGTTGSATSVATFSAEGTYVLKIHVNDGSLETTGQVTVTVNEASLNNLIINGTFEKDLDGNGIPDDWIKPGATNVSIDNSTGRTAALIEVGPDETPNWQRIEQYVNVESSTTYTLSMDIKTDCTSSNGASAYVVGSIVLNNQIVGGVGSNNSTWLFSAPRIQDWKPYTYTFTTGTIPAGGKLLIGLILHEKGKAWFANVKLEEPPVTNLIINGTFEKDLDGNGIPDDWIKQGATNVSIDNSTGRTAAMIEVGPDETPDWQRIEQYVNVESSTTYTLSMDIKTDCTSSNGASAYVVGSIVLNNQIVGGVGSNNSTWLFSAPRIQDWKPYTYTFTTGTIPAGGKLLIGLILHEKGKAWFANVKLEKEEQ